MVNCAISPLVSLDHWIYHKNAGIGGSAAWRMLKGENGVQAELDSGVGWQDPAVIKRTGLCVWYSGSKPAIGWSTDGKMLEGLMALHWTGKQHDTPALVDLKRNYDLIVEAGALCANAVLHSKMPNLVAGIQRSYQAQLEEAMDPLPDFGEAAKKYCGSGFGGYGLYLFTNFTSREIFVKSTAESIAIEPYYQPAD